jgi:hypothetical protein
MSNDVDPHMAKFQVEQRLKPYLKMDCETGEVIARLDEPTFEHIRELIRTEVRKALYQAGDTVTIEKDLFDRLMHLSREAGE